MADLDIDELERLHAAADRGPWQFDRRRTYARAAGPGEWVGALEAALRAWEERER